MAQRVNLAGTGLPIRKKTFIAKEETAAIIGDWITQGAVTSTFVPIGSVDGTWVAKQAADGSWVKQQDS